MLKNYLKIAVRNIKRNKIFSFINIIGLSVGVACTVLILLWIQDELSYDNFHSNRNNIYRIISQNPESGGPEYYAGSPAPIGPALREEFPEVIRYTRLQAGWSGWHLHYNDKNFMEERLANADPSFFEIFNFELMHGDPKTVLKDRYSIVISEEIAQKCYGDENPVGKTMQISDTDMMVTGVMKKIPVNSHLQFDYIFPAINMTRWRSSKIDSWDYLQFATYLELSENVDIEAFNKKMNALLKRYSPQTTTTLSLQPLEKIHLYSSDLNTWMLAYPGKGNITYIYIFSLIAGIILILACVNFINLSTARAGVRVKEIGVRKVAGAQKTSLIIQFFSESLLFTIIASILAFFLAELMLPEFNTLAEKHLQFDFSNNYQIILGFLIIISITGLLAGIYPALYLSGLKPIKILKSFSQFSTGKSGNIRKILVIFQFTVTVILIVITTVIYSQLHYIQTKDLGYDKDNIVHFASYGKFGSDYQSCRNELMQNPDIISVCRAFPPGQGYRGTDEVDWEGKTPDQKIIFYSDFVDFDFDETFGIRMAQGSFYSKERTTDSSNYVLNETAIRAMGIDSPIGKRFTFMGKTGSIIGIVKDYHGGSLYDPILPKVLKFEIESFFVCVKYRLGTLATTMPFLETKWKEYVSSRPFTYRFLDETIMQQYKNDYRVGSIIRYATILSIFIACLGLFGLSSFMTERRTKEIGIRKVLGASVFKIIYLLSNQYMRWLLIAIIIALPTGSIIMNEWLENFTYKIDINWLIIMISTGVSLGIALLTISFQTIKAAVSNPVESLRYE